MDEPLAEVITVFEHASWRIADRLPEHLKRNKQPLALPFPSCVIRPLAVHYDRWPYLSESGKKAVVCVIQLCDFVWWQRNVWRIDMFSQPLWEWYCTVPVIAVSETLAYEFARQLKLVEKGAGSKKVINALQVQGAISGKLRKQLRKLQNYKNGTHRCSADGGEVYAVKPKMYGDAVRAVHKLEKALRVYWEQSIRPELFPTNRV